MSAADRSFSLVIPAYNEAERILATLQRLVETPPGEVDDYEITVVDDGSTDDTLRLCQEFAGRNPVVQVLSYPENHGKGYAVQTGVLASRGQIVAFSDADLPVPPEEFGGFFDAIRQGCDLAIGSRNLPGAQWETPLARRITAWGFRGAVRLMLDTRVTDTQFGFKMFSATAARELFPALSVAGFAFDVELIYLAQQRGYRIAELPVRGVNAPGSKVRPGRDALLMLWQLFQVRGYAPPATEALPQRVKRRTRGASPP